MLPSTAKSNYYNLPGTSGSATASTAAAARTSNPASADTAMLAMLTGAAPSTGFTDSTASLLASAFASEQQGFLSLPA